VTDEDQRTAIFSHARRSESRHNLESMIALAQSQLGVAVSPAQLDTDPLVLNCLNGTLDLRTGQLRPHRPEDHISKLTPVEYHPHAKCPLFQAFLHRILDGDQALIGFQQRAIGYTLTGCVTEKALFCLHGAGNNGKTTLLEVIRKILGEYAGMIDIEALMKTAQSDLTQRAVADLIGKRFVTSSEAAEGQALHEARIKQLTGMGRLTARRIYGSAFEFDPQFKLFIDANDKPVIRGRDEAIWSRVRLIPFTVSIPEAERDRTLGDKLAAAELPGILAWAVEGCLWWLNGGLGSPEAVTKATEQYRIEMDLVADFIEDCCTLDAQASETSTALYEAFQAYCRSVKEDPISSTAFGAALTQKGFDKVRSASARSRKGLALRQPAAVTGSALNDRFGGVL
jgi:putative DNA primase/helicase